MRLIPLLSFAVTSLVLPAVANAVEPLNATDVTASDPDRAAIVFLLESDLMYGFPDGTFRPDVIITRAEALKSVMEAMGWGEDALTREQVSVADPFTDASWTHPLTAYIAIGKTKQLVCGYGDGTFQPDDPALASDIALLLKRVALAASCEQIHDGEEALRAITTAGWWEHAEPAAVLRRRDAARLIYRAVVARTHADGAESIPHYQSTLSPPRSMPSRWQPAGLSPYPVHIPPGWYAAPAANAAVGGIAIDPRAVPWTDPSRDELLTFVTATDPLLVQNLQDRNRQIQPSTVQDTLFVGSAFQLVERGTGWEFAEWRVGRVFFSLTIQRGHLQYLSPARRLIQHIVAVTA
jgi:hypothetical protein